MKNTVVGILAHVDAGKTTLAESLLYVTGKIRTQGRVDRGNTTLDTHSLEKARGITIFSSQALISTELMELTLLDTPGHVDFSSETERTLQVLDYAILVISGLDGVQSHTKTLWRLLELYGIPVFIFVTKMDFARKSREELMSQLQKELSPSCIEFTATDDDLNNEDIASSSEKALEVFFENGSLTSDLVSELIASRDCFPCLFGSGLKNEGVGSLINVLEKYIVEKKYQDAFSARVFKISHDPRGAKLTHVKVTGGKLRVREPVMINGKEFKAAELRKYNGTKYETCEEVSAGCICTVLGLEDAENGMTLGQSAMIRPPVLEPVMTYRLVLPQDVSPETVLPRLKQLEEEDPTLHLTWNAHIREIHVSLMGQIQAEILKSLIKDRFELDVQVDNGRVMYKETVMNKVEGVGHYEPLRHYAEVHLLIEPLPRGVGILFENAVKQDSLDLNWQRLIMGHLAEKQHLGVLTGSPLTDVKITLAAGRAHLKHTEGGDFRQATYRAVRQGLMQAESKLLEPFYSFSLEVPAENLGRAIVDIQQMHGSFDPPENDGEFAVLHGIAPVVTMNGYASVVASYTGGKGSFRCELDGYYECHNADEVIAASLYSPEADTDNSPDSVFCAHGGGFPVKWDKVPEYMHLESCLKKEKPFSPAVNRRNFHIDDKELAAIMEREFGKVETVLYRSSSSRNETSDDDDMTEIRPNCVIVDGYNVIFAWQELKEIAFADLEEAREKLIDVMSNYSAFTGNRVVVVFDAYKVRGGSGKKYTADNVNVVYTQEHELADVYIERLVSEIGKNEKVRVVTSDNLIQLSAIRLGVLRISAADFEEEVGEVNRRIGDMIDDIRLKTKKPVIGEIK